MRISDWSSDVCSSDLEDIPATADLLESQDDAPIIRLINGIIAEGARQGASDIHIEPSEATLRVRLRVDGVMREAARLPGRIAPLLVSRVKVMARLDIAEKRVPQDGRISLRSEEHTSELQSLMRISYAVFCFKKKNNQINKT